jgi:hypothetical protein
VTVDACYRFLQFISRKNQSASLSPSEFETAYNSSQRTWFYNLIGKDVVAPHIAIGQTERISEKLKPFKVTDSTTAVVQQIAAYPKDFAVLTAMVNADSGEGMHYIDDAKLSARLKSAIDPIEDSKPGVFTNAKTGWKVWPSSLKNVIVSYYRLPTEVKWAFSKDANGRPVYDKNTSVDPEWDDLSNEEILARCCTLLGISFQQQSLVQFGQAVKQQGA